MKSIAELIPHDKALHCIGGTVLFASALWLATLLGLPHSLGLIAASLYCVSVAIGKEIYDAAHREKHTPDRRDAAFTIAGGGLGLCCALPTPI